VRPQKRPKSNGLKASLVRQRARITLSSGSRPSYIGLIHNRGEKGAQFLASDCPPVEVVRDWMPSGYVPDDELEQRFFEQATNHPGHKRES
jgi:hypothetical protein